MMGRGGTIRSFGRMAMLAAGLALPAMTAETAARATPPALAAEADVTEVATLLDRTSRMTVPVLVNGAGPFAFIVDTGSDRTVVSERLASRLQLPANGTALLHSMSGVDRVALVRIDRLDVSSRRTGNIAAPALREEHLGGPGLLGIDSLASQRVTLDFRTLTMTIQPGDKRAQSTRAAPDEDGDVIVVRARRKAGQLILTDAHIGTTRIRVVIDTGAQNTVGNLALRRQLVRKRIATPSRVELISVLGEKIIAEAAFVPEINIGGMVVQNMPIAFADAHPFSKLGLSSTPALLLGMDALALMDRVSIDFASRTVRFVLPDRG